MIVVALQERRSAIPMNCGVQCFDSRQYWMVVAHDSCVVDNLNVFGYQRGHDYGARGCAQDHPGKEEVAVW